jgi:aryl-alcohol dehydrogenase-like predicted oxidoreductase
MRYRRLGRSDLNVSEVSLGSGLTYGGAWSGGAPRRASSARSTSG